MWTNWYYWTRTSWYSLNFEKKTKFYLIFLGHFGPNHAADPIVTRWKRDEQGQIIRHRSTGKGILEFVCIRRRDTNECAIPGGMVEKKEKVTDTLQREFHEETLNFPDLDEISKHNLLATIKDIFENGGIKIYCGYVDDPR
jgi:ADP-ribose pyrophosphatase